MGRRDPWAALSMLSERLNAATSVDCGPVSLFVEDTGGGFRTLFLGVESLGVSVSVADWVDFGDVVRLLELGDGNLVYRIGADGDHVGVVWSGGVSEDLGVHGALLDDERLLDHLRRVVVALVVNGWGE